MSETVDRVIACIREVFVNKGSEPPPLSPTTEFSEDLGLDSLDYAELVVRLEMEFRKDPFRNSEIPSIKDIADLAALYDLK